MPPSEQERALKSSGKALKMAGGRAKLGQDFRRRHVTCHLEKVQFSSKVGAKNQ